VATRLPYVRRYAEILPVPVDSNEKGDAIFEAKGNEILKKVLPCESPSPPPPSLAVSVLSSRTCLGTRGEDGGGTEGGRREASLDSGRACSLAHEAPCPGTGCLVRQGPPLADISCPWC